MGILRTDRVSGLGGANAITGSVFFPHDGDVSAGESGALQVQNANDALTFGTGDWTIEFWFYANQTGFVQSLYDGRGTGAGSNTAVYIRLSDSNNIQFFTTNAFRITGSTTIIKNAWHHVALTRTGSTHTLYVNGSSDGTYSNSGMDYIGPVNSFAIIGSDDNRDGRYGLNGYISNLRVAKELIYSAAFTVPTTALTPTSNTTLLCCQSPGNVEASFGGLILTSFASNINSKGPVASRFTPNSPVGFSTTTDVGTQFGLTFDGVTTFDSQAYMVPPGGNTRERNRGRGVYTSGHNPSPGSATNGIEFMNIQSQGNAQDFGDLTSARRFTGASSSATRGVFASGLSTNVMDFVTIATTANATDFGDMTRHGFSSSGTSDGVRGVYAGGYQQPEAAFVNNIDFITFATAGNAQDFGDTSVPACHMAGGSSRTRGVYMGMSTPSPSPRNVIEFVTIQSAGNTTDFGDCSVPRGEAAGASNSTRMIAAGGDAPDTNVETNLMEFVTMASEGNAIDFGDLTVIRARLAGISNSTRGVFLKGHVLPAGTVYNTADFVNIASTGNAIDFGDTFTGAYECSGCSDSHGGIE